jgi:hypothetical protein
MKITSKDMTSDLTPHAARATDGGWSVTWLPGRRLTQNQAITAMTIAEVVRSHCDDLADTSSRWWLHIEGWAAELGISGPHAVATASMSPEGHAAMPRVATLAMAGGPRRTGYLLGLDKSTGIAQVRIDGETVTMPTAHLQYV